METVSHQTLAIHLIRDAPICAYSWIPVTGVDVLAHSIWCWPMTAKLAWNLQLVPRSISPAVRVSTKQDLRQVEQPGAYLFHGAATGRRNVQMLQMKRTVQNVDLINSVVKRVNALLRSMNAMEFLTVWIARMNSAAVLPASFTALNCAYRTLYSVMEHLTVQMSLMNPQLLAQLGSTVLWLTIPRGLPTSSESLWVSSAPHSSVPSSSVGTNGIAITTTEMKEPMIRSILLDRDTPSFHTLITNSNLLVELSVSGRLEWAPLPTWATALWIS